MRRLNFKVEYLLIPVVLAVFVGSFFFVVYEPAEKTKSAESEAVTKQVDVQNKTEVKSLVSGKLSENRMSEPDANSLNRKLEVKESLSENQLQKPEKMDTPSLEHADFGIEGVVFSLDSGLPLAGCEVSFAGQSVLTGVDGEFCLWLDGGIGRLSFAYAGARKLQIRKFDIRAGSGLARFDVYLDESGKSRGRIEVNGVNGRVYSRETGAPLAGARITLGSLRSKTDAAGFFELWGNDSSLLTMTVAAPGYVSEMVSGIDFENQNNPFFYEISLEPDNFSGKGKRHLALVGIGARLVRSKAGYEVADLLPDSPAAAAGIEPGDRLVAVDSLAVDDFSLREIVELIRGQVGLPVSLMVEREGHFLEFVCVRERVVY